MNKLEWRKIRISFFSAISISLMLHFLLALEMYFINPKPASLERIEIQMVEKESPKQEKLTEKKAPAEDSLAKQIVDQDQKSLNDEIDSKAKFLSAQNQKVQKQTVAKNHGEFKNRSDKVTAPIIQPQLGGKKVDVKDFMPKIDIAKSVQERAQKEKEFDRDAEAINIKKAQQAHQAQQNQMMTKPGQAGGQASQSLDYIKELDPGLETLLSTREFVFYTYYSRIRKQLNQYWGPKVREKLVTIYRQGRQIASSDDKITKCLITLDSTGNLARVQIIGNSGVRELDEAAVEAFKSAAPFPNPPKGIQDQDGNIKIRWDFVLEI